MIPFQKHQAIPEVMIHDVWQEWEQHNHVEQIPYTTENKTYVNKNRKGAFCKFLTTKEIIEKRNFQMNTKN